MLLPLCSRCKMKCALSCISLPATKLASHKSWWPYFLIQFFSTSDISSCMQGIDGRAHEPVCKMCVFACTHIAMSVPEKEMMYAKLNGVFHNAPSPDPSWQPRAGSLAPLCLSIKSLSRAKGLWEGRGARIRAVDQFT